MRKVILMLCFILLVPRATHAIYKTLNDSLVQEAIEHGKIGKKARGLRFKEPWLHKTYGSDPLQQVCEIKTPYQKIVVHSWIKAIEKQPVDTSVINSIRKSGILEFKFWFYSDTYDSGQEIHSIIKVDTLIIHPVANLTRGSLKPTAFWPSFSPKYYIECLHRYNLSDVPQDGILQFTVIHNLPSGIMMDPRFKETIFYIDLSKIK